MNVVTNRDRGHVLTLVLGFIAFAGLISASIVSFTLTSLRASSRLEDRRDERYAAAAAIDTHVEYLSDHSEFGNPTGSCPSTSLELNGVDTDVTCSNAGSAMGGRDIVVVATVDGTVELTAEIFIASGSDPDVFVNGWWYGPDGIPPDD